MTGISADPSHRPSAWGPTIPLLVLLGVLIIGAVRASNDKSDRGPRYCYDNGIEIGLLEANYKDGSGKWVQYDYWCWATRPKKGKDGNWHFEDRGHSYPLNVTIPGEMLLSYTPDPPEKYK